MILENGTLSVKVDAIGGLDENGNPIRLPDAFGEPIPCHIKVNTKNNLGKQNGNTFTVASYVVFIDEQPFEDAIVKLTQHGRELGEFSVLWSEYLETQSTVKIVV